MNTYTPPTAEQAAALAALKCRSIIRRSLLPYAFNEANKAGEIVIRTPLCNNARADAEIADAFVATLLAAERDCQGTLDIFWAVRAERLRARSLRPEVPRHLIGARRQGATRRVATRVLGFSSRSRGRCRSPAPRRLIFRQSTVSLSPVSS